AEGWISHLPGTHRCMDNDRVLLWADPPITVQCDGWLIDGLPVAGSSVTLLMDRDHTAEPLFSQRSKIELPAPELRIADVVADASLSNATVQIPITLSGQDYIIPDALQFTLHVPGGLPEPTLAVPDEWSGILDLVTETSVVTNGINLKVLMLGTNDLFAVSNMTIVTVGFAIGDVPEGDYTLSLLEAGPVMLPVASEDDGSIAIPLETADGTLRLETGDQCAMRLLLTPNPTAADSLTDDAMQALSDLDALRGDCDRYAEVWLRCDSADELYACSYNLAISGGATFATNRQYFINEPDIANTVGAGGQSLTGMGGPISDEKIISHNDYAVDPYESGDWMLVARMPLGGGDGSSTLAMTDIRVELFEADGNETFILPDQTRNLTVAPNAAPTSANLSISTTSREFVRIQPEIHDVNPQDIDGIALMIVRHPAAGRVLIDPENPRGFIYHPPENGVFSGTVAFQFALTDGTDVSQTYTAEITVNNPPQFTGIPEVIHCGSGTNLSMIVQIGDADTPSEQLVFALHNAPPWLSIVNNGDGSAVISGVVPPTRETWTVFAVRVSDPLSRATSQATLLLTFDPAVGGVLLTVVDGTGGGLFEAGTVLQISARSPEAGEQFAGWEGDVQHLDDAQSLTPTVTLPDHDITLRAVFVDASAASGFSVWVASYGLADGQDGPADSPAGDGISNLEKYAFGLIPEQSYNPGSLFSMRIDAASGRIILRYEQSKRATDVRIIPIWSASLSEPVWNATSVETTRVGETDTHEIWEASKAMSEGSCFMRLRFELQPADALTFAEWADAYSLTAGQDGPADSPAGDGISNLEKYAFGLIPEQPYNPGSLFSMRIDAASGRIILRYEQSKRATDVRIIPIWSASLAEPVWNTASIETTRVGETDTHEIWEASKAMSDGACFMRLRFEL
ncbi:MAG: hypothetical protein PHX41_15415, partial [Kiritimatiellae bacterium]|nr:hypothetical protein [Kiritimatiellia bacterium]